MSFVRRTFPLLLQPKALSIKNYWRGNFESPTEWLRDSVIAIFSLALMLAIYFGGLWILQQAQTGRQFVYFPPGIALGLIFLFLLVMLMLSNATAALASLFLASDLDLLLSAPVRPYRFFISKFFDVLLSSSWITIVFLLPALFSFASFYNPSLGYYGLVLLVLVPYFAIPTAIAIIGITLYARLVPANRTREGLLIIMSCVLLTAYALFTVLSPGSDTMAKRTMDDILRIVAVMALPNKPWMPSYWAATVLAEHLDPTKPTFTPYLLMLYAAAIGLVALAFLVVRGCHFAAYSKANATSRQLRIASKTAQRRFQRLFPTVPKPFRAIALKEWRVFSRDATQIFQLLLLCGICVLYFYNFRVLHAVRMELPPESRKWWEVFLFLVNTCLEAFLITAVGTRFVFQSISLEGRTFWLLQSSPLSLTRFMWTKFICWYLPVAVILSAIFGLGAYSINTAPSLIFLKVLSSWIICYGIVGLGIGLGAYFANFSWEHSSQLAASFGSLVYMLTCVALITIEACLVGAVLMFNQLRAAHDFSQVQFNICVALVSALIIYVNYLATRWAMHAGEVSLVRRMA